MIEKINMSDDFIFRIIGGYIEDASLSKQKDLLDHLEVKISKNKDITRVYYIIQKHHISEEI